MLVLMLGIVVLAVLDDFQQIALLLGQQWFGSPVVEYGKVDAAELTHQFGVTTVSPSDPREDAWNPQASPKSCSASGKIRQRHCRTQQP
jgi:hypothetical protein